MHYFKYAVSGCVSISAFASLVDVPVGITNFAVELKICVLIAEIKTYISIIMKKNKKQDKIVSLTKTMLNTIKVLISKSLIDSYNNHDDFVSVNNVLQEYYEMKNKLIKSPRNAVLYYIKSMKTFCVSCKKNTASENLSARKAKQNRLILLSNSAVCGKKKSSRS